MAIVTVYKGVRPAHAAAPLHPSSVGEWGSGTYWSTDPECAAEYGCLLIEAEVDLVNPYMAKAEYDDYGLCEEFEYEAASLGFLSELFPGDYPRMIREAQSTETGLFGGEIQEKLMALGHDGIVAEWADGSKHVITYHPRQIRHIACVRDRSGEHGLGSLYCGQPGDLGQALARQFIIN